MNFTFSDEQDAFRASLRSFLADVSSSDDVRRLMGTEHAFDPGVWTRMCDELGLAAMPVPEAFGGAGFGFLELVVALEEMGAALLCAPFLSSVAFATTAIADAGTDEQRARLLPALASGASIGTFAHAGPSGRWDTAAPGVTASRDDGSWTVRGEKVLVTDGGLADVVVVSASDGDGVRLFVVQAGGPGVARSRLRAIDATRPLWRIVFDGAAAEPLGDASGMQRALDRAAIALSVEMVGGAQRCLDAAVAYAKERVQFGRPIGSFQAVKHRCANALLEIESARSAAYYAGWAVAADAPDLPEAANVAKSSAGDAYEQAALDNLLVHGGIGYTWEHDAHLYLRRAKASNILFGDAAYHRDVLGLHLAL